MDTRCLYFYTYNKRVNTSQRLIVYKQRICLLPLFISNGFGPLLILFRSTFKKLTELYQQRTESVGIPISNGLSLLLIYKQLTISVAYEWLVNGWPININNEYLLLLIYKKLLKNQFIIIMVVFLWIYWIIW